jgi:FXSXX-COOH protein
MAADRSRNGRTVTGVDEADRCADGLIDLTGIDLRELDALADTVLAAALRRVLWESENRPDRYSAFENAFTEPHEDHR